MNKEQTYVYAYFFDPKTELWVDIEPQLFTEELGIAFNHPALIKSEDGQMGEYIALIDQYCDKYSKYLEAKEDPKLMLEYIYGYSLKPFYEFDEMRSTFEVGDRFFDTDCDGEAIEVVGFLKLADKHGVFHEAYAGIPTRCEDGFLYIIKNHDSGHIVPYTADALKEFPKAYPPTELATIRYYALNDKRRLEVTSDEVNYNIPIEEGFMHQDLEDLLAGAINFSEILSLYKEAPTLHVKL